MDLTQFAMASFVLIGLVNGVQFAINREWDRFILFVVAVVAGVVAGYLKFFGLTGVEVGLAVGIASSGVYKVAQKVGGQ